MTREEAIYQLEDLKKEAMSHFWCEKDDCANDDKIHHRDAEALDMAIAALRAADGANAAARVKKPRAPKMTCDEMLQLPVIERCIDLWTNPGDIVLDPFDGIGSTGYQALKMGRRHIGVELKESYFRQAAMNLATAESEYFNQEAEQ